MRSRWGGVFSNDGVGVSRWLGAAAVLVVLAVSMVLVPGYVLAQDEDAGQRDSYYDQGDSGTFGDCAWRIDDDGALVVSPLNGVEGTLDNRVDYGGGDIGYESYPWISKRFTSARFEGTIHAKSCLYMFSDCIDLEEIDFTGLDTSEVENMRFMFFENGSLRGLDLSGLDFSSVKDMGFMFEGCNNLEWVTLGAGFSFCGSTGGERLCSLPSGIWVADSDGTEYGADEVPNNVADTYWHVRTSGLTGTCWWEIDDDGLLTISPYEPGGVGVPEDFPWSYDGRVSSMVTGVRIDGKVRPTTCDYMFRDLSNATSFNLAGLDTSRATSMEGMFEGCTTITSLDLSSFNMSRVTNVSRMFNWCQSLATLSLPSSFVTSRVTDISDAFAWCEVLKSLDTSGWDVSSVQNMSRAFYHCEALKALDVSRWNTGAAQRMDGLFLDCSSLTTLAVGNWDTSSAERMDGLFQGCTSLATLDVSKWTTSNAIDMNSMFDSCSSLKTIDVSQWDVSHVTSKPLPEYPEGDEAYFVGMCAMFQGSGVTKLDLSSWDNEGVASVAMMCSGCNALREVAVGPKTRVNLGGTRPGGGGNQETWYSTNDDAWVTAEAILGERFGTADVYTKGTSEPCFDDADPADEDNHGLEVDWMGRMGISTGWEVEGRHVFRGMDNVKRCDFAAFLYRMADLADNGKRDDSIALTQAKVKSVLAGVSDCSPEKTDHAMEVAWMIESGVSKGWPDKGKKTVSFKPMADVARQDMAAFLYRFADLDDDQQQNQSLKPGAEKVTFKDVKHGDAANHATEVEWLASVGVTKGWPASGGKFEFRGKKTVARQDMAAFMYRLNTHMSA